MPCSPVSTLRCTGSWPYLIATLDHLGDGGHALPTGHNGSEIELDDFARAVAIRFRQDEDLRVDSRESQGDGFVDGFDREC